MAEDNTQRDTDSWLLASFLGLLASLPLGFVELVVTIVASMVFPLGEFGVVATCVLIATIGLGQVGIQSARDVEGKRRLALRAFGVAAWLAPIAFVVLMLWVSSLRD